MKPAREPASSRPKPCASLKKYHESCPLAAPYGLRRKKQDQQYVREIRNLFSDKESVVVRDFAGNDYRLRPFIVEVSVMIAFNRRSKTV